MKEPLQKKIHLSDVIDYKRDIEPYYFVELYCGTGGGKTHMIEDFVKGEMPGAPRMTVLLITSRRAKVDETLFVDCSDNEDNKEKEEKEEKEEKA